MRTVIVLPRNMHFGPLRATAIDLCVRDFVRFSAFRATTLVVAESAERSFEDIETVFVPHGAGPSAFAEAIRRHRPEIVLVQQHRPTASRLVQLMDDVPVALHRHGLLKAQPLAIKRWLARRDFAHFRGLIAASRAIADNLHLALPGFRGPIEVIHNGLDTAEWRPATVREDVILFVGRLAPEKGVLEAATALRSVLAARPGWRARLLLAEASRYADYAARVRSALAPVESQVEWQEDVPHEVVKAAFESAAISLVPSVWAEPFGRTALEAMAAGSALVTSARGGLREIVGPDEAEAASILGSVDPGSIESALMHLTGDEGARRALAVRGRARAEALFDIRSVAATFDRALSMMAERPRY
jgi:glycosyltransferase involved in cell wall biosynthesis